MAIFVTGLTGAVAEENDVTLKMNSGTMKGLFGATGSTIEGDFDIVLNENVLDVTEAFRGIDWSSGTILFNCNPKAWTECFNYTNANTHDGDIIVCNYTSLCTNIDKIIATRYNSTVIKGSLVVV